MRASADDATTLIKRRCQAAKHCRLNTLSRSQKRKNERGKNSTELLIRELLVASSNLYAAQTIAVFTERGGLWIYCLSKHNGMGM